MNRKHLILIIVGVLIGAVVSACASDGALGPGGQDTIDNAPRRILVISDSLAEGMGEVDSIEKTWPNLLADAIRTDQSFAPGDGGLWLPSRLNGTMFEFSAGTSAATAHDATEEFGLPGSVAPGPVTWQLDSPNSALVFVSPVAAGSTFTATAGGKTTQWVARDTGPQRFRVAEPGQDISVSGDGAVIGILAEYGSLGSGVEVYNLAQSGSMTADWLRWHEGGQLGELVSTLSPDLVIMSLGGNDFFDSTEKERFSAHLRRLYENISADVPTASWILGTQPVPASTDSYDWETIQSEIRALASDIDAPLIDLASTMPSADDEPDLYSADRIHLTNAGHAFVARVALRALQSR